MSTSRGGAFVAMVIGLVLSGCPGVGAGEVVFSRPTTAPVLDPFRLPDGPYGAGNRGIEYDTVAGDVVVAAGGGIVVFSGSVAGDRFVSVDHPGGLRTTYGFVRTALVRRGASVERGDALAVAGGPFHFTVRLDGHYIDPEPLFGTARTTVHLVPHRPGSSAFLTARTAFGISPLHSTPALSSPG